MNSPSSSNYWNGRFIGDNQRYRIDKPLAVGGMGEVLLATDTRVGQQIVLKLLKDTLVASQEMRKRFEREVAVCAALQSDHIVKISDCGVTPEGYPFYVMEYLRGQTLRQLLLHEKRLSVERTVSIISQVCQALQMAHQGVTLQKDGINEHIQVIHRDLKPDNIFLIPTDLGEWVKILDFGVAKIRNDSSEQSNLTTTFIGTFRYAAPEQIQNKQNLDARADIYSLGIILYEMLSAADPFGFSIKGNNISEASWVVAHTYELPKPLREQLGCENISAEMETAVIKCLQKDPNNRFASVGELNQALQEVIKPTLGTASTINETIVQPQPDFHQETVSKPLQTFDTSESEDETILLIPQLPNQQSNNETVPRPLQPNQPQPPEGSMFQHRPSPYANNNNETVPRPLQPNQPQPPEGGMFQHRPSPYANNNNETVPRPLQPNQPQPPEGGMFQPQPSSEPKNHQNPANRPINNEQASNLDNTLYQPRPVVSPSRNNIPDNTIFQPKPEQLVSPRSSHSFGRNIWIGLGIVLACLTGILIFFLFSNSGSQDLPGEPSSTQSN
ncbi:serine/threonine protein kinase [Sphaerospermopsis kisseleviana NIES-73]|nr:serine/threonine protein kinase [Sphaerospermopsis kisseleviana NIES-73]